jgi:dTDP-4-amino-4,6-dideoxygalactose transaminase
MPNTNRPAVLGGIPAFWEKIPICRPTLPEFSEVDEKFSEVFDTGLITNAKYVKEFEEKCEEFLGVRNAVAVANCTSGLMLTMKALDMEGEVIVPSFTFSATVHAILWNGIKPVFVECDPETFNLDTAEIREKVNPKTCAIMGVYVFGNPPDISCLEEIATECDLRLIFDAAHAMGGKYHERHAGNFGDAEVFSLSPTKLVPAGEGGLITTNDDELARRLRIGRDYGNPGNYNCEFVGLNARLTEFSAILGLRNLKDLGTNVLKRNRLVDVYRFFLGKLPGIAFQKVELGTRSTFKDFSILIDPAKFGLDRDAVAFCLEKDNISTKKYYFPPLHRQDTCRGLNGRNGWKLPVTEYVSQNILSLPLYSHMGDEEVVKICEVMQKIYDNREKINRALKAGSHEKVKV